MGETAPNPIRDLAAEVRQHINQEIDAQVQHLDGLEQTFQDARQRVRQEISAHVEQLENLQKLVGELQERQKKLEEETEQQLQQLADKSIGEARKRQNSLKEAVDEQLNRVAQYEPPPVVAPLDKLLASVRNLITATLPEQVLEVLTEEAEQMGARAAIFDVRGKAAWGAAARGFADVSEKTIRSIAVPLNQDGPFRHVFESGGHVEANADQLKRNRNVLDKFKPGREDPILLLPIRSAGSVSAIVYLDAVGRPEPLPVDALNILSEFAGAQLDRLMALSGGLGVETEEEEKAAEPEAARSEPEPEQAEPEPVHARPFHPGFVPGQPEPESPQAEWQHEAAHATAASAQPAVPAESQAAPPPPATGPESVPAGAAPSAAVAAAAPAAVDISQLSEEEQKYHKDAKRFAKLLVSEIELYNKPKVADGRKNKDLYKRLRSDIDRSRQTYQKRFSKPLASHVDYFHEELVRMLANSDASLLGPEYPGPSA